MLNPCATPCYAKKDKERVKSERCGPSIEEEPQRTLYKRKWGRDGVYKGNSVYLEKNNATHLGEDISRT